MRDWTALHRKCFNHRDGDGRSPCRQRKLPASQGQHGADGDAASTEPVEAGDCLLAGRHAGAGRTPRRGAADPAARASAAPIALDERLDDRELTARKRELITLMLAALTRREGCVDIHAKRALSRGASPDEVAEAIGLASSLRTGAAFVHAARAFDADLARAAASRP
jgi:AhpD family alkylhydroperoxidase